MKKKKIIFWGFLLCSVILLSCKKEEEPTNVEKLTSYTWQIASAKVDPPVVFPGQLTPIASIFDIMEPCYKDDTHKFIEPGSISTDVGANKCNSAEANYNGAWILQNNETSLYWANFGNTGMPVTFYINELSGYVLTLKVVITNTNELGVILKAYGLEYLIPNSKANNPLPNGNSTFTLTLRAL